MNYILLVIILILACILSFIAGFFTMWCLCRKWSKEYCTSSCRRPYSYNRNDFNYLKFMSGLKKSFHHIDICEFDPLEDYLYEPNDQNIKIFSTNGRKQEEETMSNLMVNMITKNAPLSEIDRAIKYSMVVIKCENHKLNFEKAYKDFNIEELKKSICNEEYYMTYYCMICDSYNTFGELKKCYVRCIAHPYKRHRLEFNEFVEKNCKNCDIKNKLKRYSHIS